MRNISFSPCSEFPNDNLDLHEGAVWVCLEVTGAATWEPPRRQHAASVVAPEPVHEPEDAWSGDEAPAEPSPGQLEPVVVAVPEREAIVLAGPEGDDEGPDCFEVVDEILLDDVVEEHADEPEPLRAEDPFADLVGILEGVARDAGANGEALATLRILVGRERRAEDASPERDRLREQAAAWQAILRGESEDFGTVGASTLDEWSALVLANALGQPQKTDLLRRELRRRGVAAFGVVAAFAA